MTRTAQFCTSCFCSKSSCILNLKLTSAPRDGLKPLLCPFLWLPCNQPPFSAFTTARLFIQHIGDSGQARHVEPGSWASD
jgi:hypothetical protein